MSDEVEQKQDWVYRNSKWLMVACAIALLCVIAWPIWISPYLKMFKAKDAAAALLIDPSSAQFRNVHTGDDDSLGTVCGEINGKNRLGAYTGFTRFAVRGESAMLRPDFSRNVADLDELSKSIDSLNKARWYFVAQKCEW